MKKKKIASVLTACAMLMGTAAVLPEVPECVTLVASAEGTTEFTEGTYESLAYWNYGDHIEIFSCNMNATEVEIPSEIEGVPVTAIRGSAFGGSDNLTSVTIPGSVLTIGANAFSGCEYLTSVIMSDGLVSIGARCFSSCIRLNSVSLPSSLDSIGINAFSNCSSIYDVFFNGTVEEWKTVSIEQSGNEFLTNARIRFEGSEAPTETFPVITVDESCNIDSETQYSISMEFGSAPKMQYLVGEELDLETGTIVYSYEWISSTSGATTTPITKTLNELIDDANFLVDTSAFDNTKPGYYPIYITYTYGVSKTLFYMVTVSEPSLPLGNLNGDSTIDANDASMLLVAAANAGSGADSGLTAEQIAAADLNADGNFDASDASLILMYAAYAGAGGELDLAGFLAQL